MAYEIGPSLEMITRNGELSYQTQDALCSTCSKISWAEIVRNPESSGKYAQRWRYEIVSSLYEMKQNYRCPFCRLCTRAKTSLGLESIVRSSEEDSCKIKWYGQRWLDEHMGGRRDNFRERIRNLTAFRLQIDLPDTDLSQLSLTYEPINVMVHVDHVSETRRKYRCGQFIKATEINSHLFQRWRSHGRNSHRSCHNSITWDALERELMEKRCFRLVDVEDLQVRPAGPGCKYFCLSYVWGNVKSFRGLPGARSFCRTKTKIMTVVRTVGDARSKPWQAKERRRMHV